MTSVTHPDAEIESRMRAWGVEEGSDEHKTALALFPTFDHLLSYVRVAYLKVECAPTRSFFAEFVSGTGDGLVDGDRDAYLSGPEGLRLAHRLEVTRSDATLFAWLVQAWNRAIKNGRYLMDFSSVYDAWVYVFKNFGTQHVKKIIEEDVFYYRYSAGIMVLFREGMTAEDILEYDPSFGDGEMVRNRERNYFLYDEVLSFHRDGVPSDYAMSFRREGLTGRIAQDIVPLWRGGVAFEYAVPCGEAGHSAEDIIRMYSEGIPLEYALASGGKQ
jgi:hypothetical protein